MVPTGATKLLGDLEMGLALGIASAPGGKNRNEAFEFSPRFKHEKLLFDLDLGDPKSMAAQRDNKVVRSQSL
jgi:hypothetical protein